MHDLSLLLLSLLVSALLALIVFLVVLLVRMSTRSTVQLVNLLRDQQTENQLLRNQLRSPDPQTLAGLNYSTLPPDKVPSAETPYEVSLGEAIDYEQQLARSGYETGDLGNDLESAGWSHPVFKPGAEPTAFDLT